MTTDRSHTTLAGRRLPRVALGYPVEFSNPIGKKELPFVLGILADLSGHPQTPLPPLLDRNFLDIDIDNFETVLAQIAPQLTFSVENKEVQLDINLHFRALNDFAPEAIAAQVPALAKLLERRRTLDQFRDLTLLDRQLSTQVNAILHSAPFQQLEAAWRGLHYLVSQTESSSNLKVRVLNITKKDLRRDLLRAAAFDRCIFFKKVHDDIYGSSTGEPFAAFILDFAFDPQNEDIQILSELSQIAGAIHAPCIAAASSEMFDLEKFADMTTAGNFTRLFEGALYAPWRRFRESEGSRYIALALPRILLRLPYGRTGQSVEAFDHEEDIFPENRYHYLWGNAAYAFGARLTAAFSKFGWCAAISGVNGGGTVDGLPVHFLDPSDGGTTGPAEVTLDEKQEFDLAKLGFLPLCNIRTANQAVFFTAHSCHKPKEYQNSTATAAARLFARLDYLLCASRFAHHLCCMFRDALPPTRTPARWENYFNEWISQFVLGDGSADVHMKARRPLTEARIVVTELAGKPNTYRAVFAFHPHFQLENPPVEYRVIATLPQIRQSDEPASGIG